MLGTGQAIPEGRIQILNKFKNQRSKMETTNQDPKCSARLEPRVRVRLHDLKRSHYDCVSSLDNEIDTLRSHV